MNGGDFVVSWEKSKRIKRLSAVNNNNSGSNKGSCSYEVEEEKKCEMGGGGGCDVFDKEVRQAPSATIGTASTSNKRFKLPRKVGSVIMRWLVFLINFLLVLMFG